MFTGIVTHIGTVKAMEPLSQGCCFIMNADLDYGSLTVGASIAHSGVCLTVTAIDPAVKTYQVEAWHEAMQLSNAHHWQVGTRLNLERSLQAGDELGGHMVYGHVDGMAKIMEIQPQGEATRFVLETPQSVAKFIAPKGSVALDGVSLTVNGVRGRIFDVLLIAHTLSVTTWGERQPGDFVNLEVDPLARYVARLMEMSVK